MRPDPAHVQPYRTTTAPQRARPLEVLDPGQRRTAEGFLRFRASARPTCWEHRACPADGCTQCGAAAVWEQETVARAAKMLRADRDAPMSVRMMGLTADDLAAWDDGSDLAG